jgi:hypothetical protein
MKTNFRNLYYAFTLLCGLLLINSGCEKDITVDLPQPEKQIVVQGSIFQDEYAMVALTYTFPFFQSFADLDITNPANLEKFLVLDATIKLSNGIQQEYLTLTIDTTIFPPVFYKGDTIKGQIHTTYTLEIQAKGSVFTASSYLPPPIPLDSINWAPEGNLDSLGPCNLYFQEPPTPGNIYRLFVKRQGYPGYVPLYSPSVLDDQAYNGQYIEYPFYRPNPYSNAFVNFDSLSQAEKDEAFYWKRGDTVSVKFCTLDRASFEFIRTMEQAANTTGNPFSNPTSVKGNVSGGAIGGWCAYGVFKIQRVIR